MLLQTISQNMKKDYTQINPVIKQAYDQIMKEKQQGSSYGGSYNGYGTGSTGGYGGYGGFGGFGF